MADSPPPARELPTAEEVVRRAIEAHATARWDDLAALVHPEALRRFHRREIETQRLRERSDDEPPGRRYPAEMPEEVRGWLEEQRRRHREEEPPGALAGFAGVSSLAELEALAPEEAFARWLEGHDPRTLLERSHPGRAFPEEVARSLRPEPRIVGTCPEDEATAHVLYRVALPGSEPSDDDARMSVVSVRRAAAGWRIWRAHGDGPLFGLENVGFSVDFVEDRVDRLRALAEQPLSWPAEGEPRVRAEVVGWAGGETAPEGIRIEVRARAGGSASLEVPYGALTALTDHLAAWTYLPEPASEDADA